MQLALVTTVHDPDGRFLDVLDELRGLLARYDGVYFRCTSDTDAGLVQELARQGEVAIDAPGSVGHSRREALRSAWSDGASSFLYCDFDRWLHWSSRFPSELDELPRTIARSAPDSWYVCLGRTARAFATHPDVQQCTEGLTNQAFSSLAGWRIDATAGACWLSREGAEIVLAKSCERTNATDLEWPSLILARDPERLGYLGTEGLEFETATFHTREIEDVGGRDAWVALHYDCRQVWEARAELMHASIQAAVRVLRENG